MVFASDYDAELLSKRFALTPLCSSALPNSSLFLQELLRSCKASKSAPADSNVWLEDWSLACLVKSEFERPGDVWFSLLSICPTVELQI